MVLAELGRYGGHRGHRRGGRHAARPPAFRPFSYVPGPETVFVEADRQVEEDENAIPDRPAEIIEAQGGTMTGLGDSAGGGLLSSRLVWFVLGAAAVQGARKMGWLR